MKYRVRLALLGTVVNRAAFAAVVDILDCRDLELCAVGAGMCWNRSEAGKAG